MALFDNIFPQHVPQVSMDTIPEYYYRVFAWIYRLLGCYFLVMFAFDLLVIRHLILVPLVLVGAVGLLLYCLRGIHLHLNLVSYTVLTLFWAFIFVREFGWGCGGQHFLIPLLIVTFFSIFLPMRTKVLYWLLLVVFRMGLFYYSLRNTPHVPLDSTLSVLIQTLNSLMLFLMVAVICTIFSTNIQSAERELLLSNQALKKEAETDPLTGLTNRRFMLSEMLLYKESNPKSQFSIAIADIDFFKKVNDTYGHNCGDYLLRELSALFLDRTAGIGTVCRWGGEEFCFFFPEMNLDQAGSVMTEIHHAVEKIRLNYEGNVIQFTITAGVEENDFESDLQTLIDNADQKLYIGKNSGRNRVVL